MPLCNFCNGDHFPRQCRRFATAQHRCLQAFTLGLCKRCLCQGHDSTDCTYRKPCYYCGGDHHQTMCLQEFDSGRGMPSCIFCSGDHLNAKCTLHASAESRRRIVKAKELCKRCFGALALDSAWRLFGPERALSDETRSFGAAHRDTADTAERGVKKTSTLSDQLESFEALLAERKAALRQEREELEKEKKLFQQEKASVKVDKREVEAERQAVAQEKIKMDAERAELNLLKHSVESGRSALLEQLTLLRSESVKREDSELRRANEQIRRYVETV
ncbi:Pao retrotransposon peptidase family protein [Aphelenchoides avenae]|nr:Pao retrotransposon peptidase family protein [Aphelenchus avenae]